MDDLVLNSVSVCLSRFLDVASSSPDSASPDGDANGSAAASAPALQDFDRCVVGVLIINPG